MVVEILGMHPAIGGDAILAYQVGTLIDEFKGGSEYGLRQSSQMAYRQL